MDETGAYYTEQSKSERKTPIQYINAYMWNLERCLVVLFFFFSPRFSLALSIGSSFSAFLFYLTLYSRWKLFIVVLSGCFHVIACLCRLRNLHARLFLFDLWCKAGFDVDVHHILPQGVQATVTLIGSVVCVTGSKVSAECEWDSLAVAFPRVGSVLKLME